jgi:DNA-binding NtrC family response regulator
MKILIVDDQRSARSVLRNMLGDLPETEVLEATSKAEALEQAKTQRPDLILLDIRLSKDLRDRGGLEVLAELRRADDPVRAIMVTALTEMTEIREAMHLGACDYIIKDELSEEVVLPIVEAERERIHLRSEVDRLHRRVDAEWGLGALVGSSDRMDSLRRVIGRVAASDATVLIRGETGTGKELVARAIHHLSKRRWDEFVAVNCTALPATLIESQLFGHERGAFTGADRRKRGQLELAGAGTILLDEIADMPIELQAKLLRVLETQRFLPLGAERETQLRARVLAATNAEFEQMVSEGSFRSDLFFRLNVVAIEVPALSERVEDIPELVERFVEVTGCKMRFDDAAISWLTRRPWPGNVRELRNAVQRLAVLATTDRIGVSDLEEIVGTGTCANSNAEIDRIARALLGLPGRLGSKLRLIETAILHHAIEVSAGNKSAAARLVGLDRKALDRRLERREDEVPSSRSSRTRPIG